MNYGDLLYEIPQQLRDLIRSLEKEKKKLIKTEWSKKFNISCLNENLLPKHTNVRNRDPAMNENPITYEYRRNIIAQELEQNNNQMETLRPIINQICSEIQQYCTEYPQAAEKWQVIEGYLNEIIETYNLSVKTDTIKRLNHLYMGQVFIKNEVNSYINLSDYELSNDEKEFLNLGLNFHIQPKYKKLHKQAECEILFQNLLDLKDRNAIEINPTLSDQLRAESNKHRNPKYHSIITPKLKQAAKSLKDNREIIIRRADKSSLYVILNKSDYMNKIDNILQDQSKFKPIKKTLLKTSRRRPIK